MRVEAQRLRQELRDAEQVALFDTSEFATEPLADDQLYEHQPPWLPPGTAEP